MSDIWHTTTIDIHDGGPARVRAVLTDGHRPLIHVRVHDVTMLMSPDTAARLVRELADALPAEFGPVSLVRPVTA